MNKQEFNFDYDSKMLSLTHKEQKKIVKPYRHFQIKIILLFIFMLILLFYLKSLNSKLNIKVNEFTTLENDLSSQIQMHESLTKWYERLEVNFECLHSLDKGINIDIIRNIDEYKLINNFISTKEQFAFNICYKATLNGDNAINFRAKCGYVAPLLFLIETVSGFRFGAYISVPLTGEENGYKEDKNAFLFSLNFRKKYKVIKNEKAIFDIKDKFPAFGNNDIYLDANFLQNEKSFMMFPDAYEEDFQNKGNYILNGGIKYFRVKELEVINLSSSY